MLIQVILLIAFNDQSYFMLFIATFLFTDLEYRSKVLLKQ